MNSSLVLSSIPAEVQKVFEDQCCTCINTNSNTLCKGLLRTIPDMTSSSDMYIQLQQIYQAQARADMEALTGHLCQILANLNKLNHQAQLLRWRSNVCVVTAPSYESPIVVH